VGELPVSLVDGFGRAHRDLRVSLTDRCSLRCTYCMPADGLPWIPSAGMLTTAELLRVVGVAVDLGVQEVRLTGGEPLLHPDVVDVVARLHGLPRAPELSLTTNGLRLPGLAAPLADAGLERVNISLDTLRRDRFVALTRRDRLVDVLAGVAAAKAAGLHPVKVNAVLMRGVNEDEAVSMLRWALDEGLQLRFIEQMPLDPQHSWDRGRMVTAQEVLAALSQSFTLTPVPARGSSPAEEWLVDGGPATVGVVGSVTRPFCGTCDRVRLTADGQLRSCLFAPDETDLRAAMRTGASDDEVARRIRACLASKRAGHGIDDPGFLQPTRPMSAIGG
jgi:cyclic pyranopterin phosphate synthase